MKNLTLFENFLELLPSDFGKVDPYDCRMKFDRSEHETIAQNIMRILWRTGNEFRPLSWQEYRKERLKDGNFSDREKEYFDNVIRWCDSEHNAKQFSTAWCKIRHAAEINANKYNI